MVGTTSQATKVFTHRKSARKRYAYTSWWKDKDLMKCIIWDEEKHKIGRPLPLTNISLAEKAEKPLKEYSELHIKNNNAKIYWWSKSDSSDILTRSLLTANVVYHKSCYQAFRSKGWKKKSKKDEKKNFADSGEAAWNEFCQIVKIHLVIQREVYSAIGLKSMYNNIKSTRNLSSSVRSIDIKDNLKNTFKENIVFWKINGAKTNTEYSKESGKIVDFGNIQLFYSLLNFLTFKKMGMIINTSIKSTLSEKP